MINTSKTSISHFDSSSAVRQSTDGKESRGSSRKKEGGVKKGKAVASGKNLTSYLDKRPSFKSHPKSKYSSSQEKSPRYTLSEVYANGGKPFPIGEKMSEKLLWIANLYHSFLESPSSSRAFNLFDMILLNVHDAYLHPRKPRGPFSIKKYNSSFCFIVNEAQEK